MSLIKQSISAAAAIAVPFAFGATMALAAPPALVVDTTDDTVEVDGFCSLREAIGNTNAGAQTNADCAKPKGKAARINLTNPGGDTITLSSPLVVTAPVEITGPGSHALEITRAVANDKHFHVEAAMTLTGVRMTNAGGGGSITVQTGSLTLDDVVFSGNENVSTGGGAVNLAAGTSVSIYHSKFFDNHTTNPGRGGAILARAGASVTIGDSVFAGNSANGNGGAIAALSASVTVTDSVFTGNTAVGNGGTIFHRVDGGFSGDTTISNSTIVDNLAVGAGGGVYSLADIGGTIDTTVTGSVIAGNDGFEGPNDVFLQNQVGTGANNYTEVNSIVDFCDGC